MMSLSIEGWTVLQLPLSGVLNKFESVFFLSTPKSRQPWYSVKGRDAPIMLSCVKWYSEENIDSWQALGGVGVGERQEQCAAMYP